MKVLVVVCMVVFSVGFAQAEVYRYINEQGKVAYTDVPRPNAKKITISPITTYPSSENDIGGTGAESDQEPKENIDYERLVITSPKADASFRRHQLRGVRVNFTLEPSLQQGHKVVVYVDGFPRDGMSLEDLERGEHTLRVEVEDSEGVLQIASTEVSFSVQQVSKLLSPAFKNQATPPTN